MDIELGDKVDEVPVEVKRAWTEFWPDKGGQFLIAPERCGG
jgi:hypothetical protein